MVINGNELSWFTDYLFGRQQYVQLGKCTSSLQPVYSGVPQGPILGPLLFNLYFNDFADRVLMANVLLYADDTVLYVAGKDVGIIENTLTRELEEVEKYLDENELLINLKKGKTEVMLFGTAKCLSLKGRQLSVKYRGTEINTTKKYIYLGYTLDNTLKLSGCFDTAYRKCCNRLHLLSTLRHHVTADAATKIFRFAIVI